MNRPENMVRPAPAMRNAAMPVNTATLLNFLRKRSWSNDLARCLLIAAAAALLIFLVLPVFSILQKALQNPAGEWTGLQHITAVLSESRIWQAATGSLQLALLTLMIVLPTALLAAFALTRSAMPFRKAVRGMLLLPMLCPSLMPAISLVYLFGNQGLLKSLLGSQSIYGPVGIVTGEVFYTLPHAILILSTALSVADARLYEAAQSLGANRMRQFFSITLSGIRFAILSVSLLVLTMVITDFGVPKVIGGQTQVLALEAYKQVIGQQNFSQGAVIGLLLLSPALLSFALERYTASRPEASLSAKSMHLQVSHNRWRDALLGILCLLMLAFVLALFGTGIYASLIRLWPYQMELTLRHFNFDAVDGGGWQAFLNSLQLSLLTATGGTLLVTVSAYLSLKKFAQHWLSRCLEQLAWLPMAIPGMVLGLGYIFCFNQPANPLNFLYGSMSLMVMATIMHFYTTAYLTLSTQLRKLDKEFEAAGISMGRSWLTLCWRVTLPLCLPALIDVFRYFFVSAMTTVSCVIFLYTPDTVLASVSVLNMDDAGDTAAAAAMATLIVFTSFFINLILHMLTSALEARHQRWQKPLTKES
jgi:iron(III) transport system permease protein